MLPILNLGPHFSKGPLLRRFTLTNSGRRHQSLVWGTEGFSFVQKPKRGGLLRPINMKDMKYKVSPEIAMSFVVAQNSMGLFTPSENEKHLTTSKQQFASLGARHGARNVITVIEFGHYRKGSRECSKS